VDGKLECATCLLLKSVEEFYKKPSNRSGYHSSCKVCHNQESGARYAAQPREKKAGWRIQHKFGITWEQYQEMLLAQGGVCAICKQEEPMFRGGQRAALAVDHDHACCSGARACGACVRALICSLCNHAIGVLEGRGITGADLDAYIARHAKP
jgi:hypothetical protein